MKNKKLLCKNAYSQEKMSKIFHLGHKIDYQITEMISFLSVCVYLHVFKDIYIEKTHNYTHSTLIVIISNCWSCGKRKYFLFFPYSVLYCSSYFQ